MQCRVGLHAVVAWSMAPNIFSNCLKKSHRSPSQAWRRFGTMSTRLSTPLSTVGMDSRSSQCVRSKKARLEFAPSARQRQAYIEERSCSTTFTITAYELLPDGRKGLARLITEHPVVFERQLNQDVGHRELGLLLRYFSLWQAA
jgi:hypothetical protein